MRILRLPVAGAGVYFRHSLVPVRRRATADLVRQRLYHQSAAGTVNHDLRCTKYSPEHPGKALFGPAMMALLAALIVLLCAFVVQPVKLPMATGLKPALAVALGHFLLGLLCIVSQRNILRQIFGYCLMENGSHLVLALLARRAPELVEIGIATDAIFAVIVMVLLARKIWRTHGTLDVNNLTALKG